MSVYTWRGAFAADGHITKYRSGLQLSHCNDYGYSEDSGDIWNMQQSFMPVAASAGTTVPEVMYSFLSSAVDTRLSDRNCRGQAST